MGVQLKRPEVAEKFECTLEKDQVIHVKGYTGKISNTPMAVAERLAESKAGYLKKKEAAADTNTPVDPNSEEEQN